MKVNNTNRLESFFICGVKVNAVGINEVIWMIDDCRNKKSFGNYIVIANANDVSLSKRNKLIREATNTSSLSVPDGISLVLLARLYGYNLRKRVYGPELMLESMEHSQHSGYSHFFYGATERTLDLLIGNLKKRFPELKIAGRYAPPFRELDEKEEEGVICMINKAKPDIIWVGLGCPKQQPWMYNHRNKVNVPVMIGVGAAFDFLAGVKPQAPRWIRDNGFEWLFRLLTEPNRLWRRYLVNGSLFIFYIAIELIVNGCRPTKIRSGND